MLSGLKGPGESRVERSTEIRNAALSFNENIVKEIQQLDGRDEMVLAIQGRRFVVGFFLFAVLITNDRQR